MNLMSFEQAGRRRFGAYADGGIVDLTDRVGRDIGDLRQLLAADALGRAREVVAGSTADVDLATATFLPPIPAPEKILCIGVNYANRNAEYRDGSELPKYPSIFMRTPGSLVGHRRPIVRPRESAELDYEGEIVIVIGKAGRRIAEVEAEAHIAGLTCMNEGTIRDWTRHGKFNVTQGKNFDRTGSIGPWMTTADAFASFDDLRVTTRVNGEIRQDDTTANLMFSFRHIIAYVSTFTELTPGDLLATGTPVGTGARRDPPVFLKPGDVVEVEVAGVGKLMNEIIAEESWGAGRVENSTRRELSH
jgi:2-keto-4-pentenoate hydratase/2-oxohepta-3-ene-1,7-dioic acid hydratase in catechol pathway